MLSTFFLKKKKANQTITINNKNTWKGIKSIITIKNLSMV